MPSNLFDRLFCTGSAVAAFTPARAGQYFSLRLAAYRLTTAIAKWALSVCSFPVHIRNQVEGPRNTRGSSLVNRRTIILSRKRFAESCPALALSAALLAASAWDANADPLVFTFSDDGSNSTIIPSGSLDLLGLQHSETQRLTASGVIFQHPQNVASSAPAPTILSIYSSENGGGGYLYTSGITVTFSGLSSYTGKNANSSIPSYYSNQFIAIQGDRIEVDSDYISSEGRKITYDPTGAITTFAGTLSQVLKDNNFHFEAAINGQRIIFTTAQSVPSEPEDQTAKSGDRAGNAELGGPGRRQHRQVRGPDQIRGRRLWPMGTN